MHREAMNDRFGEFVATTGRRTMTAAFGTGRCRHDFLDRREPACGRQCKYVVAPDSGLTKPKKTTGDVPCVGALSRSLNLMGDHHGIQRQFGTSRAVEQSQDRRPEDSFQSQVHLSSARPAADGEPCAGARTVQPGNRQQAARLRLGEPEGPGRSPRRSSSVSSPGDAAQDLATGSVRDHPSHSRRGAEVDQGGGADVRGLPVSEPHPRLAAPRHSSPRAHSRELGQGARSRPGGIRHAFDETNQGDSHLSSHEESTGRSAVARAFQARIDSAISGHRGGRRTGDRRTD
jgi:hypothetical protein